MKIIYKPDDGRITVAEAKRLIYNALPEGNAAKVYMHVDADGKPVWDGPIEIKEVPEADLFELNEVVLDMCQQGLITPRFRYRPTRTDYIGNSDDAYLLDHADFVVMAQILECRVIVGEAPATRETENLAPTMPEGAKQGPTWTVRKPQRFPGYAAPLYRFLVEAHREGSPRPKARDVVEAWRSNPPAEIAKMLADGFDYYNAEGDTESANLEAIRKAIDRMTAGR